MSAHRREHRPAAFRRDGRDRHVRRATTPGRSACSASWPSCSLFTKFVNPNYSLGSLASTATSVLPLALAAVAQAVVVISGGIDLSISSQMALTSCVAATHDEGLPGRWNGRR